MKTIRIVVLFLMGGIPAAQAFAEEGTLPACARGGSSSLIINGKPALKMSDVLDCPPEMIEIIPSITIDGQPMVRIKNAQTDTATCAARGSNDVFVAGEMAQRTGDADCAARE